MITLLSRKKFSDAARKTLKQATLNCDKPLNFTPVIGRYDGW